MQSDDTALAMSGEGPATPSSWCIGTPQIRSRLHRGCDGGWEQGIV
jgi:hypothetical protein